MNIVEISASLGNGLKRYNVLTQVSMSKQPFSIRLNVLYGVTKPTDIVQTYEPTNILIDAEGNPIGNSKPVYFGIRVYPFISEQQQINCDNNNIRYGKVFGLSTNNYFTNMNDFVGNTLLPQPYTGQLYPEPTFVESFPSSSQVTKMNYQQAMQQFINDCVFPTKPKLNLTGQSQSSGQGSNGIPYFSPNVYTLNNDEPTGVLNLIQDKKEDKPTAYKKYMVQFNGQNLNFKFGMADNLDFTDPPKIYLPYLYRTYVALVNTNPQNGVSMGVIMQCLLYDNLGDVITG